MSNVFQDAVVTKYHIFNSLFLSLPYKDIFRTGSLLPILTQKCEEGFARGESPRQIIEGFFEEILENTSPEQRIDLLFSFIKYIERQVVLFDSVEDAAFDDTHRPNGKGSLMALMQRLDNEKVRSKMIEKLDDFSVRVVLTAHPTQFYPGKVLGIINDLEGAIKTNDFTGINQLLLQLGKTAFINKTKPTPYDEAVSLCWFLENVFYEAVPRLVAEVSQAVQIPVSQWRYANVFRLGFWPGGDRDGNPYVNAQTTIDVAERLRATLLRAYYRDIRLLKRRLTFQGVEDYVAKLEKKMNNTIFGPEEEGYLHVNEVLQELAEAREILAADHEGFFVEHLDRFVLKLRLFGFFFASLDVRQVSTKHEKAWQDILRLLESKIPLVKYDEYVKWSETKKIDLLLSLNMPLNPNDYEEPITKDFLESIQVIQQIQQRNGKEGAHRYVISNCSSALNVIEVLAVAKNLIADNEGAIPLDVVPLFETVDDLANASHVMSTLYQNEFYRRHLSSRNNGQTIMLGFSDGTKDGGYLRANWSIYRAKEELTKISRKSGIRVTFFDGRGGPPGRGGGNNQNFYASQGNEIEDKEIQLTVQGQTISSNYGTVTTAIYNLERLFTAGLENTLFNHSKKEDQLSEKDKKLLEELAEASYKSYLKLKNDRVFVKYLEERTPLRFYGQTNIGSRPTKRSKDGEGLKFEDLRAIPFVGSWAQMKQNVPGYYGFGEALEELIAKGRIDELKALYQKSLFFRTLVENSMQALMKSYFPPTEYLRNEKEFSAFWQLIYDEYIRSRDLLLKISGQDRLLGLSNITRESIEVREKIVLPLTTIQQYALQILAEDSDNSRTESYNKLVMRAMFGIINAARNSA